MRICWERTHRKVGPHELALLLGSARSTIYAVLRRAEFNRLGAWVAKRPVLRYEWPAPGNLVHLDIKRFFGVNDLSRNHDRWTALLRASQSVEKILT